MRTCTAAILRLTFWSPKSSLKLRLARCGAGLWRYQLGLSKLWHIVAGGIVTLVGDDE
ncbi:MAG: hypothetical protein HC910_17305 [Spirulinaceae cyanobacterium SM2_1_0]|nr:hypothetical protein [Spirulinaceae cyanobacterium SM2_1_0]